MTSMEGWDVFTQCYFKHLHFAKGNYSPIIFDIAAIEFVNKTYRQISAHQFKQYCLRLALFCQDLYDGKLNPPSRYHYSEIEAEKVISVSAFRLILEDIKREYP